MANLNTLSELRTNISSTIREDDSTVLTLIDNFLNLTLLEINAFHPWTYLRRKQTFDTEIDRENYALDEEVDYLTILRQRTTPMVLIQVPDELFYKFIPNPEDLGSGTPRFYRLWQETGFSTNLAAADTVYVRSSSTADGSAFKVIIVGRNSSGDVVSESLTLNGTTNVTSATTFAASGLLQVSKSAKTTGTITVYRTTGATVLSRLPPETTAPRFKTISLYPIPSAVVTMSYEYIERTRLLLNDADVPMMDSKWNWVLREGALAKAWEYKQNETASALHQGLFDRGLLRMRQEDTRNLDYVPVIQPRIWWRRGAVIPLSNATSASDFPDYALRV